MSVHVCEETLSIKLELVALKGQLSICLDEDIEEGGELVQPCALEQVALLHGQVVRGVGSWARFLGPQSGDPLVKLDDTIIVSVNNFDETVDVFELDVMFSKDTRDLIDCKFTVLVQVEKFEALIDGECLVTEEGLSGVLNLPVGSHHNLHEAQEHKVLNLALFLKLVGFLLLLVNFLFLSLNRLLDLSSLVGSHALFQVFLLLALSWGQVVSSLLSSASLIRACLVGGSGIFGALS